MKKLLHSCALAFVLMLISTAKISASHGAGGVITYKSLGNDSVLVYLTVYRDCNGTPSNVSVSLSCSSNTVGVSLSLLLSEDITPVCASSCSRCNSSSCSFTTGLEKRVYYGIADLSSYTNCCSWTASHQLSNRSFSITTGSSGENVYLTATFNKCTTDPNSSPVPIADAPQVLVVGTCTALDLGMFDADGDSLVYSLVSPKKSATAAITYNGQYSYDKPLYFFGFPNINLAFNPPQCRGFHLDSRTGQLRFRPMQSQYTVMAIKTEEFRNGTKIGEVIRDFPIIVYSGTSPALPVISTNLSSDTIYACIGENITFNLSTDINSTTDSVKLFLLDILMGATLNTNNSIRKTSGTFSWIPDTTHKLNMIYPFVFLATSNVCPLPGRTYKTIYIKIQENPYNPLITSIADSCNGTVQFSVTDSTITNVQYSWTGEDGINIITGKNARHTYSDTGKYEVYLHQSAFRHCTVTDTFTHTIPPVNFLKIRNLKDSTLCYGSNLQFNMLYKDGTPPYSYSWNTGDTVPDPIFNITKNTMLHVTITDSAWCKATDSAFVNIFPRIYMNAGSDFNRCISASSIKLAGSPTGGIWVGTGIDSAGNFDPATAGLGVHELIYFKYDNQNCYYADTTMATVIDLVVSAGNDTVVCDYDQSSVLIGWPNGGTWSGPYVNNNRFNATSAPPGNYSLKYNFSLYGCIGSDTMQLTLLPLPLTNGGNGFNICQSADSVTLIGWPAGGYWSGKGVVDSIFYPAMADTGSQFLIYSYTDYGCTGKDTIIANIEPVVSAGKDTIICLHSGAFSPELYPTGGILTGDYLTGNKFYPHLAGTGTFTLTYTYSPNKLCSNTDTVNITVAPLESVNAGKDTAVCHKSGSFSLSGKPSGGTFSGTGVFNNIFFPDSVNPGKFRIIYTYADSTLCGKEDTMFITVNPLPIVNAGFDVHLCEGNGPTLINPIPNGGSWSTSIPVSGNTFNTSSLASGIFTAIYSYTDKNSCVNTDTLNIVIDSLITVDAGIDTSICHNSGKYNLSGTPAGGIWVGKGVSGSVFYPALADTGKHSLYYTYGMDVNCRKTDSLLITVLPRALADAGNDILACENNSAIKLTGKPAGGIWTGTGIDSAGNFYPATSGTGKFTAVYHTKLANGCNASDSTIIHISAPPQVNAGNDTTICKSAEPLVLSGIPTGGNWSGVAVTDGRFYPALTQKSSQKLYYTYSDTACSVTDSFEIKVHKEDINFFVPSELCTTEPPFKTIATPAGGIFSGETISGDSLLPNLATTGSTKIYYSYIDSTGCATADSTEIKILPPPLVDAGNNIIYCTGMPPLQLSGTPAGGVWSGPGIIKNEFYPDSAGVGTFQAQYKFVDSTGCEGIDYVQIIVKAPPVANFYGSPQSGLFPLTVKFYDSSSANTGNWHWYADTVLISTDKDPVVVFNKAGNYDISLILSDTTTGCKDSATKAGYITIVTGNMEARNARVKIYPNPANELLVVEFESTDFLNGTAQIFSVDGKLVKSLPINNTMLYIARGGEIKAGVYLLVLKSLEGKAVFTTIIFN